MKYPNITRLVASVTIFGFLMLCTIDTVAQCTRGNCITGYGEYNYKGGHAYKGEWKDNKRHGMGNFIFKNGQVLLSVSPKDFSFIAEEGMMSVFSKIRELRMRADLIQNSALNFSICLPAKGDRVDALIEHLEKEFRVLYNRQVSLLTVRHYNDETLKRLLEGREILVEQRSRQTARFVVRGEFSRTT